MNPLRLLKHKFLRDTATLQVGSVFNAIGNIVATVALAHLLGARAQGQFFVATLLYALLWMLVNQGASGATVSQIAAASARGLELKVAAWLAFLTKAYLVIGALLFGAGYFLLPWLARLDHAEPEVGRWAWWLTLTPVLEMPRVVACAALQGTRRMLPLAQTENAQEAARVVFVVLGALWTGTAAGPVLGLLASSLVGSLVALELYRGARAADARFLPSLREILAHVRDVPLKAGLPLGLKLGAVRSIDALNVKILPGLILERFGSTEWVAYLRIAQSIMSVPLLFMQGISRTTFPVLSQLAGIENSERFRKTFVRASLLGGAFISAGLLASLLVIPLGLELLFPPGYREPIWITCLILMPGLLVMSFSIANDTFYLVTNTLNAGIVLCVCGVIVNLIVVTYLAWRIPTTGVAWGLSFTMATSLMHYVYAGWYFRAQRRVAPA